MIQNNETSTERDLSKPVISAEEVDGEEKVRLWRKMADMYPTYDDYQKKTEREIPLLILRPTD